MGKFINPFTDISSEFRVVADFAFNLLQIAQMTYQKHLKQH